MLYRKTKELIHWKIIYPITSILVCYNVAKIKQWTVFQYITQCFMEFYYRSEVRKCIYSMHLKTRIVQRTNRKDLHLRHLESCQTQSSYNKYLLIEWVNKLLLSFRIREKSCHSLAHSTFCFLSIVFLFSLNFDLFPYVFSSFIYILDIFECPLGLIFKRLGPNRWLSYSLTYTSSVFLISVLTISACHYLLKEYP